MLTGSISGIALAADNGDDSEPKVRCETLLNRVCDIYQEKTGVTIDQEALKDAFAQAGEEMRSGALEAWLQNLVDQGQITQQQADDRLEWWQAKPDIPNQFEFGGHGRKRGFGRMRGFRPCAPVE